MFDRLKERARRAAQQTLSRIGLTGVPVLRLPDNLLRQPDAVDATLAAVAASARRSPSVFDLLVGRLWPAGPEETVLLTADSTHDRVIDVLLEPLVRHNLACILFIDPDKLGTPDRLIAPELAQLMTRNVVVGLWLQHTDLSAAQINRRFEAGRAGLQAATGYAIHTAATDQVSSRLLEDAARRHNVTALFHGVPGLASHGDPVLPRLTVGPDVRPADLRALLDASPGELARQIGRIKLDAVRRDWVTR